MTEKQMIKMLEGVLSQAQCVLSQAQCVGGGPAYDLTKLVTGIRSLITFLKAMEESE